MFKMPREEKRRFLFLRQFVFIYVRRRVTHLTKREKRDENKIGKSLVGRRLAESSVVLNISYMFLHI